MKQYTFSDGIKTSLTLFPINLVWPAIIILGATDNHEIAIIVSVMLAMFLGSCYMASSSFGHHHMFNEDAEREGQRELNIDYFILSALTVVSYFISSAL